MECFWSAPNIFLAATCCPASILHRAQNCCLVSLYPVWFTVARKLVQMRKGGWMTRQPFMCSRTIRNGRAGSIRKWWWWPHGYPSAAFETPFTGNQPRHRQRVFITHVQHYKAEIEPESYSAIVIDLFSMLSSQSLASSSTNESSRNWKSHGRTTLWQFSTHCAMPK